MAHCLFATNRPTRTALTRSRAVSLWQRVMDAMYTMIDEGLGSMMVKDIKGRVVGFVTQRDLLRCIVNEGCSSLHLLLSLLLLSTLPSSTKILLSATQHTEY